MEYADDLKAKLKDQIEEWESVRDDLLEKIETEKRNIADYTSEIEKDMIDGGGATTETAIASLNKEYAEKRLHKAEADLKAHYDRPLYTVEEYDAACTDIRKVYDSEKGKLKKELKEIINEAMDVIDRINGLKAEGNACISSIRAAVEQTGKDPKAVFKDAKYGTSRSIVGGILYQYEIENALKDARKQLERTI